MTRVLLLLFTTVLLISCGGHEIDFSRSLATRGFADFIFNNGKVVTVDKDFSIQQSVAIKDGAIVGVGSNSAMRTWRGPKTREIDLGGRTVIPGLIDSHIHATVAGLTWDGEIHWEQVHSLADGLNQIAAAVKQKPAGSWIVVAGGWVPTQFPERRFPTREELDAIAPGHPVYVQYLRQGALLNGAGLVALGITDKTPAPSGGRFEKDANGKLTGWLQGDSGWEYAYNKIPHLTLDRVAQSLRNCFRELNRLGLTSVGDLHTRGVTFAHRRILSDMARGRGLTLRLNYYIAATEPSDELEQLRLASEEIKTLNSNDLFRFAGFAEALSRDSGDSDALSNPNGIAIAPPEREKFRSLLRFFVESGHNFYLHTSQDSTARQLLDIIEQVHKETPFTRQRITFAPLEDATAETLERIKKLGGAISVHDRLVLTGERNVELWGEQKARNAPPLRTMIQSGIPLGAGTDAFRSANYSPMLSLWWLVTGKTVAGTALRDPRQNVTREEALRMYTSGSAWLTFDEKRKGSIEPGKFADLVVLNADYLTVPEDQIRSLESLLTMVGGRVVYAVKPFAQLQPQ